MEQGFIDILHTIIKEQGKNAILDKSKCKAFLADYTKGEYKKESRFLMQALDAKVQKSIETTKEIDICKKQQVRLLHEDYGMDEDIAQNIVDTLAFVLKGVSSTGKVKPDVPQTKPVVKPVLSPSQTTNNPLLKRVSIFLEDSEWEKADEYCEKVLDSDPENVMAYIGKLCAELKIKTEADFANCKQQLDNNPNFQKAIRFADANYKSILTGYNQVILDFIAEEKRRIGDIIPFGDYDWRVLNVQNNKALILSENIIEKHAYNSRFWYVTWGECTLRRYLHVEFLQKFTSEQQKRIEETLIINSNNPWFGTKGGNDTKDKIFLLSIEEVVKYFGDSEQLKIKNPKNEIDDQYNSKRITRFGNEAWWWWLRSPGGGSRSAAIVGHVGYVDVFGFSVCSNDGGVRPALWLNL